MRFKAVKDEIYPFIQFANSFTSPKNLNTVLQNILIDAEPDGVTLRATDMQVGFSGKIPVSVEETGTATVSGKKLLDIIKEIPDGSVIDFSFDGSKINIDSGKSSFKLSTISHEIFPTMAEITPEYYLKIKSSMLYNLLKKTSFCISTDASKIEYTGSHMAVYGDKLEISAADFQRIATSSVKFDEEYSNEFMINIPRKTVMELLKILDEDEYVEIETDRKQIIFTIGQVKIFSKLIEKYIKSITKLFANDLPLQAKLNRAEFLDVIKRVSAITSEVTHGVVLSFKPGTFTVYSLETEYGTGHESIDDFEYNGEPLDIIFNAKHVAEMISNIDTDYFYLHMVGERNPAVIIPETGEYKYLVVPISINRY
ncbi:DNA polymerase III, beta subunit [Denitrovibrio acetiphilus DSM 12809]|uniref:Beta sliding clamp n=1 Tax=Denitrovibrio acetiphilus (strain DSM 12809 / NBRC 114555 / N2460) TaxID=522772 RepID=D4H6E5_DENA2|nr:DNA polymerase III subunit beta [Denitrovibrio acetiphilus]ADD69619.1 DNA polymerase III, beta subunit [Denitrovibrio acetiphilus DSM 12809]